MGGGSGGWGVGKRVSRSDALALGDVCCFKQLRQFVSLWGGVGLWGGGEKSPRCIQFGVFFG